MTSLSLPLCNIAAREAGEDPIGTASRWDQAFFVALPLAQWASFRDPQHWSEARRELQAQLGEKVRAGGVGFSLLAFDDGSGRSLEDGVQVRHYARPDGAFAQYRRRDYQLNEAGLLELLNSSLLDGQMPEGAAFDVSSGTDWHVCTNGQVDAACGKFGYPLYVALSQSGARAWRTAHFGGHRFAPTVTELPAGRAWGFLDAELASLLRDRAGDHTRLRGHYRGWSALGSLAQVAEGEAFFQCGWWWLDAPKSVKVLDKGEGWAEVALAALHPDGAWRHFSARVQRSHSLETRGKSALPDTQTVWQYRCQLKAVDGDGTRP